MALPEEVRLGPGGADRLEQAARLCVSAAERSQVALQAFARDAQARSPEQARQATHETAEAFGLIQEGVEELAAGYENFYTGMIGALKVRADVLTAAAGNMRATVLAYRAADGG